jgi:hypothetical protein
MNGTIPEIEPVLYGDADANGCGERTCPDDFTCTVCVNGLRKDEVVIYNRPASHARADISECWYNDVHLHINGYLQCILLLFDECLASSTAGYDNVGSSMISVFQCITQNGWSTQMYR